MKRNRGTAFLSCLMLVLGLLLAGCGNSSGTDTTSTLATTADSGATSGEAATTSTDTESSDETFTRENWATLASDPAAHKGAQVDLVGQVFLAPEKDADGTYWQMYADPKNSEWNTLVGYLDPNFSIADGDFVHVIGVVKDKFEGENLMGGTIIAPIILADTAEIVDAIAAATPALRTADVNLTQDQNGLTVTLSKAEFASDETRVFVTVLNNGNETAHVYGFSTKAVQGDTQFDPEYSSAGYPEVQSDILSGIKTSGVVVFGPMDPTKETRVVLEGSSEDYNLNFEAYSFTIPAG